MALFGAVVALSGSGSARAKYLLPCSALLFFNCCH